MNLTYLDIPPGSNTQTMPGYVGLKNAEVCHVEKSREMIIIQVCKTIFQEDPNGDGKKL
jgi:hypothetical protein